MEKKSVFLFLLGALALGPAFSDEAATGTLIIVNRYGGGVYYVDIQRTGNVDSGGGGSGSPTRTTPAAADNPAVAVQKASRTPGADDGTTAAPTTLTRTPGSAAATGAAPVTSPPAVAVTSGDASRAPGAGWIREGEVYGPTALIPDGGSKSYTLPAGSYSVLLNFYRTDESGGVHGFFTSPGTAIVVPAGQTRTLTIEADGTVH